MSDGGGGINTPSESGKRGIDLNPIGVCLAHSPSSSCAPIFRLDRSRLSSFCKIPNGLSRGFLLDA